MPSDFYPPVRHVIDDVHVLTTPKGGPDQTSCQDCGVFEAYSPCKLPSRLAVLSWAAAEGTRQPGQKQRVSLLTEIVRARTAAFSCLGFPQGNTERVRWLSHTQWVASQRRKSRRREDESFIKNSEMASPLLHRGALPSEAVYYAALLKGSSGTKADRASSH